MSFENQYLDLGVYYVIGQSNYGGWFCEMNCWRQDIFTIVAAFK